MVIKLSKHDIRKNEILDIAQKVFYQKGYEGSSVQDILNAAQIAKGTFYHYFKSKEDLLNKLVEVFNKATFSKVSSVASENISPIAKFGKIFKSIRDVKVENIELMIALMGFMYDDKNILFKKKIDESFIVFLTPLLTAIISQGNSDGSFHTFNPRITAELILSLFIKYGEIIGPMWQLASTKPGIIQGIEERMVASINSVERILGIPENTLNVVEKDVINYFKNKFINKEI